MKIILSNTDKTPIYEQLKNQIRDSIFESKVKNDEKLPSIRKFAADLGVSVITIKRAYDDLEAEGYIYTVGGKGSFVAGLSLKILKQKQLQIVENKLSLVIKEMKIVGVKEEDVHKTISLLWEDGE